MKKIKGLQVTNTEKEYKRKHLLEEHLWGLDWTDTLVQFCKVNLIIQGDGYKNIYNKNSLDKQDPFLKQLEGKFDIVVANPPFDLEISHLEKIRDQYSLYNEYGFSGADVLFLERCFEFCKPGGRIAIVLPHRFIDAKNFESLRQWILDNMVIRAIINLPVGVFKPFGGSNARTSILYLRKPNNVSERRGKALIATIRYVGFELGTDRYRPIPQNDLDALSTSPKMLELKKDEEEIHGIVNPSPGKNHGIR